MMKEAIKWQKQKQKNTKKWKITQYQKMGDNSIPKKWKIKIPNLGDNSIPKNGR